MNLLNIINQILTSQKDLMMVEQCLWLVGNITGDSKPTRDIILGKTCVLQALEALI